MYGSEKITEKFPGGVTLTRWYGGCPELLLCRKLVEKLSGGVTLIRWYNDLGQLLGKKRTEKLSDGRVEVHEYKYFSNTGVLYFEKSYVV